MYDSNIGRWFVQDPLAENAPSLTPYHFTSNNPINRIDPNGMRDDDYYSFGDGRIDIIKTEDPYDRFFVEDLNGDMHEQAKLNKHSSTNGVCLVEFPNSGKGFSRYGEEDSQGDHYVQPIVAAALFGAINSIRFQDDSIIVQFGDMSSYDGDKPGLSHNGGGTVI